MTTKKLKKPDRQKTDRKVSDERERFLRGILLPPPSTLGEIVRKEVGRQIDREIRKLIRELLKDGIRTRVSNYVKDAVEAGEWWNSLPEEKKEKIRQKLMEKYARLYPVPRFE